MTADRTAAFALRTPRTLSEAALLLAAPGARALAGGTDLLPNLRHGLGQPAELVDISRVAELCALSDTADGMTIGSGVTLARLEADAQVSRKLPVLAEAARVVAGPAHRSVATLGGNLCQDTRCVFYNQSEWWRHANGYCLKHGGRTCHVAPQGLHCHAAFCGDLAPALLVLGATLIVAGTRGTREVALADFYVDDGAGHLALQPGELVVAVRIASQPAAVRTGYRKARVRGGLDFPLAGVAVRIEMREARVVDLRVALCGTNSRAFLLDGTATLIGAVLDDGALGILGKLVQKQTSPMRTTITQANYRRQVAATLVQRLTRELAADRTPGMPA